MRKEKTIVKNETGLHARPASELAKLASKFKCDVEITAGEKKFNAKSILGIMSGGVKANTEIEIICEGEDEDIAIKELVQAFEKKFGE